MVGLEVEEPRQRAGHTLPTLTERLVEGTSLDEFLVGLGWHRRRANIVFHPVQRATVVDLVFVYLAYPIKGIEFVVGLATRAHFPREVEEQGKTTADTVETVEIGLTGWTSRRP